MRAATILTGRTRMNKAERVKSTYIDQDGCRNCKHAVNENKGGMESEYSCPHMKTEIEYGWVWAYGVCSEWEKTND